MRYILIAALFGVSLNTYGFNEQKALVEVAHFMSATRVRLAKLERNVENLAALKQEANLLKQEVDILTDEAQQHQNNIKDLIDILRTHTHN